MAEGEDRTQAASEKRLQRARDDGQAPLSREVVSAAGLAAAALLLTLGGPGIAARLGTALRDMLAAPGAGPLQGWDRAAASWVAAVLPLGGAVVLAGAAAVLLQTGFLLNTRALTPDPGRVSPRRGLGRLFGPDNAVAALKAAAKLGVLAWVLWQAMAGIVPQARAALDWTSAAFLDHLQRGLVQLVLLVLAAQTGIALLDVGWTRWRYAQRMRMGREELRQEQRESDGDPRIKAKLRQLRQARARRRMLAAVAHAAVVVTNPTHYAVALAYRRGVQGAPRVVAKGADEVAARIRDAAARAGVPVVADPPLARALYTVSLDSEVPAEHFRAVAGIIAYVWRLKGLAGSR